MQIIIREIELFDYENIHSMIANDMGHDEVSDIELSQRLNLMRSDKNNYLYVAVCDDNVVGFISATKFISCIDGLSIDIGGLMVSKSYQGEGVGGALLEYIEKKGLDEGITGFSITCGLHRKEAHAFYEKRNYKKGGYAFYKGLVILQDGQIAAN